MAKEGTSSSILRGYLLLLKDKIENVLEDLEKGMHINCRMDLTNWVKSIYPKRVRRKPQIN